MEPLSGSGSPGLESCGEPHCRSFFLGLYNEPARFVKTWSKGWLSRFFQCFKTSARFTARSADAALSGAVPKSNSRKRPIRTESTLGRKVAPVELSDSVLITRNAGIIAHVHSACSSPPPSSPPPLLVPSVRTHSRQLQGFRICTASSKSATPTPEFSSNVILRCTFGDDWSNSRRMALAVAGLMISPWYGNHS